MTYISPTLRRLAYERAEGRCEYCLYPERQSYRAFEVDHIYATKHGGETTEDNLSLSCFICNRHKGSDIASLDRQRGNQVVRLFHPRLDDWHDHFELQGAQIVGKTDIGRVTEHLLQFNTIDRVKERQAFIDAGLYP